MRWAVGYNSTEQGEKQAPDEGDPHGEQGEAQTAILRQQWLPQRKEPPPLIQGGIGSWFGGAQAET